MTIGATTFSEFFRGVHGYDPFPWQARLAAAVVDAPHTEPSPWPRVLDVPTGAGKTSALDVAVYALARSPARMPRRTVLVVDRRIVVDQAGEHARRIQRALADAKEGPVRVVADALRALWNARDDESPVEVAVMRGGMPRDNDWGRRPDQPLLGVSTVDQLGSRLLFRGYGIGERSASIHAGLIGNDTLVLLDEVHLAEPFAQTLAVIGDERRADMPLPSRFFAVRMSATPGAERPTALIGGDDRSHPVLGPRLRSRKLAALVPLRVTGDDETKKLQAMAQAAVTRALELQRDGSRVVGIVLNRVDSARFARAILDAHETDALLITGRMRPVERDRIVRDELLPRCGARSGRSDRGPLIVVATQCIEAGADLDFDGLVTECASLDALKQRFGRLDRGGLLQSTRAFVIGRSDQVEPDAADPVYGNALGATWRWLTEHATSSVVDFGIDALADLETTKGPTRDLLAPKPNAPVLLPGHVDAWAQTAPRPDYDPDIALWLHGPTRSVADVQLVWREDLTLPADDGPGEQGAALSRAIASLSALRPSSLESMTVPLAAVRRWLTGGEGDPRPIADVLASVADEEPRRGRVEPAEIVALRWRGDDSEWVRVGAIAPGDVLVVPSSTGGILHASFDPEADAPVTDIASVASLRARAQVVIRLGGAGLTTLGIDAERTKQLPIPTDDEPVREWRERFKDWASTLPEARPTADGTVLCTDAEWSALRHALMSRRPQLTRLVDGSNRPVWQASVAAVRLRSEVGESVTEDDASSFRAARVTLSAHSDDVRRTVEKYGVALGFSATIVSDLGLAAWLHDVGKADSRFQRWLVGGSEVGEATLDEPLAKSALSSSSFEERDLARRRAQYPKGYRHELLSLAMIEGHGVVAEAHDVDLVLHLVASHHGFCRPFAPLEDHPDDMPVRLQHGTSELRAGTRHRRARLDSGVSDRFHRLNARYGPWGLAWLEAVLRLADHRASERNGDA